MEIKDAIEILKDHRQVHMLDRRAILAIESLSIAIDTLTEVQDGLRPLLPCSAGTKVWLLLERLDGKPPDIKESRVIEIVWRKTIIFSCWIDCPQIDNSLEFRTEDFGKIVFLTREAAEKALEAQHD